MAIQAEIFLAGAANWTDAEVSAFPGDPFPASDPLRNGVVPVVLWISGAIAGLATFRLYWARAAAVAEDERVTEYLSAAPEQSCVVRCKPGIPVPRITGTTFAPWTLRVTTTGKTGDGRIRVVYTFEDVIP